MRPRLPTRAQALRWLVPATIVLYAALLRADALTQRYGVVSAPAWAAAMQATASRLAPAVRPAAFRWEPAGLAPHRNGTWTYYTSDPYTYLGFAREMTSFYAAHYREPVFPFATKLTLWLLNDQDVAVSVASAAFSVLLVLGTYLLGSAAFSRAVGAVAAVGMAIEYDVVSWDVLGWRDDAFAAAVVLSAWAMVRQMQKPSRARACVVGMVAGLACLVRITSLTFLLPGLLLLFWTGAGPWRDRARAAALAGALALTIVAPYLINCWREFGDPLYAINYHTGNYLEAEGRSRENAPSAMAYVARQVRTRPIATLDTITIGLTAYPYANKWHGFDRWWPGLGTALSWMALVGLVFMTGSPVGRFLLAILTTALAPFAPTWPTIADWRFTELAYPFYLIAAGLVVALVIRRAEVTRKAPAPRWASLETRAVAVMVAAMALGAVIWWWSTRLVPPLIVLEHLRAGEAAALEAGGRDRAFFGDDWDAPQVIGDITVRRARAATVAIALPLPRAAAYDLRLRADPTDGALVNDPVARSTMTVFANGTPLGRFELTYDPSLVGFYEMPLPATVARAGWNRLELLLSGETGVRVWYVLIRPRP